MKLDINKVYNFIPKEDKEYCKKNRIHMEVVIIVKKPIYVTRGLINIKMNSVYATKIDEDLVVNFIVTNDQNYIKIEERWDFKELRHFTFDEFPVKIYYK